MRQQVDCDLVVVFDDEAAAGEHFAGQLVSHLKHIKRVLVSSLLPVFSQIPCILIFW